jgi:uncharacterized membrane protein YphA (DoxX/SURF4 family)
MHVLTLTRVATVSVPIVAETCARRGAGFSRFLQLVPGEGESQTTGKLCVLHFSYKGQLDIASLCNGRTKRKWGAMLNLESGDRIELFYEDSPKATIRATVNRLLSDRDERNGPCMNSKAAQLRENGTEIVRLFARFALGASFLSAVADRFGLWGPHGAKNVSWGDFAYFVEYTGAVMSLFPSSLTASFAWAATVAETLFGILLIAGFKMRMASVLSGLLLLSFAMGMVTGLGIKTPFDYSVFSAAAAAFLLAFWEPDRFTLDKLLNRSRNSAGDQIVDRRSTKIGEEI